MTGPRPCEQGFPSFDAALACGCADCTAYTECYGDMHDLFESDADASDDGGWRGRLVALASNPAVILGRVVATFEDAVEGWLVLDNGREVCCGLVNVVPESLNVATTVRPATPAEIAAFKNAVDAEQFRVMNDAYEAQLADDHATWEDRLDAWREELETNL